MGLPAALQAHKNSDLETAAHHYKRALDQKDFKPLLFQNYGALLRSLGQDKQAYAIYKQGLSLFPEDRGIRLNYANLIRSQSPTETLYIYLSLIREKINSQSGPIEISDYQMILEVLDELNYFAWSYEICRWLLRLAGPSPILVIALFKLSVRDEVRILSEQEVENLKLTINDILPLFSNVDRIEYYFSMSWLLFKSGELSKAVITLNQALSLTNDLSGITDDERAKIVKINNVNCWNASNVLLANQDFVNGWRLFDYGLQASAMHAQKWQRALPKVFTSDQLPLWRGQNLDGKRLLLLEEQAVGDVMQFLTLLPRLVDEALHIGIVLSHRLVPIYERSFEKWISAGLVKIWTFAMIANAELSSSSYDFQLPIGSICQYRFNSPSEYGLYSPNLIPPKKLPATYYRTIEKSNPSLVVGISWRGGGSSSRIKEKSVSPGSFKQIFDGIHNLKFVNLQYGDVSRDLQEWDSAGFHVHHESRINPLKDLDEWLDLVQSCNAVVSVANTTIHGAGGLNIPTICLLSLRSDWRWFKNASVKRSYWYPSVGIARQSQNGSWSSAFQETREWILAGAPFPKGPITTL